MADQGIPTRPSAPRESRVRAMFDDLVPRYDLLNDILSMGFVRSWRRAVVRTVPMGGTVLDLGCGTGLLGRRLASRAQAVVGLDTSAGMLAAARRRAPAVRLLQASAFRLPFADRAFDAAVSAFVLRNLQDLEGAFVELARVVRAGGVIALVDITEPRNPVVRRAFDAYFAVAAPALGSLVGRRDAYRYLVRSLAQLPPPDVVRGLLRSAGFAEVRARTLAPGTVTLFTATRRP